MGDLKINFCGVDFVNPFTIAASPPSDRRERIARAFEAGWGGAVFKTTSVESFDVDLVYPMMGGYSYKNNRHSGFYNIDLISERHVDEICEDIRFLKERFPDRVLITSISADKEEDWTELVTKTEEAGTDMLELSMSCPQGEGDGTIPINDPDLAKAMTKYIRDARKKDTPIIVKMNPIVTDLTAIASAAKEGGADAFCCIDTVRGYPGVDLNTMQPRLSVNGKSTYCGLSGPMIKPVAMACIAELTQSVGLPIAGVGGITTWQDAAEFLLLGASNLQVCTAIMRYGYGIVDDLKSGLSNYMDEKGFASLADMVGKCNPHVVDNDHLERIHNYVSSINPATCIGCNNCYVACNDGGFNAISLTENGLFLDESKCRGCGVCQSVCPVDGCMVLKRVEKEGTK